MAEYISQQLIYQEKISTSNMDSSYLPTQIQEFQFQEIDKGNIRNNELFLFSDQYFLQEYDKGKLINTINGVDVSSYVYTQYFKMRGFFAQSNSYQTWISSNLPNLNPPSGNNLIDIVIVSIWFA